MENMLNASVAGLRRLRSLAGRLILIAGVVLRFRWVVNMVHAVATAVDKYVFAPQLSFFKKKTIKATIQRSGQGMFPV